MESPAVLLWLLFYWRGEHRAELAPLALLGVWQLHYVHRTYVFPFRMRASGKRIPIMIVLTALAFNTLNAFVNATQVSAVGSYGEAWLRDLRFLLGVLVFLQYRWTQQIRIAAAERLQADLERAARRFATALDRELGQASIALGLENLMTYPYIADAVRRGALALHGAWFDVATGQVLVRTPAGYVEVSKMADLPPQNVVNL